MKKLYVYIKYLITFAKINQMRHLCSFIHTLKYNISNIDDYKYDYLDIKSFNNDLKRFKTF